MTVFVALLRSINLLGNSRLSMAELRAMAAELGLGRARTYIASGNLLFTSRLTEQEVQQRLEQRLGRHMGRAVTVIIRTAEEMDAAHRANPFPDAPCSNTLAFFMNSPPPADLLATIRNKADDERIAAGVREVYVAYGERGIGRSRLRIPAAETGTARNINTVAKLALLARELA